MPFQINRSKALFLVVVSLIRITQARSSIQGAFSGSFQELVPDQLFSHRHPSGSAHFVCLALTNYQARLCHKLCCAQAGAEIVYAVEASKMAKYAQMLADSNPGRAAYYKRESTAFAVLLRKVSTAYHMYRLLDQQVETKINAKISFLHIKIHQSHRFGRGNLGLGPRIVVVNSKIEELTETSKVDVLVSEPMGTLLVNERMLETYLYARDHFLKPGGKMFPVSHVASLL